MDPVLSLRGEFAFIVIAAAVLTLIVSALLLRRYRRATLQQMALSSDASDVADTQAVAHRQPPSRPLTFLQLPERVTANTDSATIRHDVSQVQRRSSQVYLAAGVAFAIVMTLAWLVAAGGALNLGRALMLFSVCIWPTIIALSLIDAIGRRDALRLAGLFGLFVGVSMIIVLMRNPGLSLWTPGLLWLQINLPPTLIFLALLHNRIRAVGPLVFAFLFSGFAGVGLLFTLASSSDYLIHALLIVASWFGLGALSTFTLLHLLGFLLFTLMGRAFLRVVGQRYRCKAFSDRSISMDSLFLIFAVVQSFNLAFESAGFLLAGPLAYCAYAFVVKQGFKRIAGKKPANPAFNEQRELLLLRVFSLGRRSQRFFDSFQKLWRLIGSVSMIAGPDLVTSSVEPHEFLAYAGGDLSRSFVTGREDLEERVLQRDRLQDPDGRYRVNEFFCHDNTWRMSMQRLATESSAILMDLRSFSASNQGCLFELGVLLNTVELDRIVFLIDETTDQRFLETTFLQLWSELDAASPNQTSTTPAVRFYRVTRVDRQAISTLISYLVSS